uniref:RNA 2',3'-cyclic phosphodiesterase n=1 Tax=Candidatus Kentrum sp. FW TaxID=2126338 RepID=A0A450U3P9_9GAMM|nr:MAG: 2'-5' RNA ligase [Candidatus Kentron sp. FW]
MQIKQPKEPDTRRLFFALWPTNSVRRALAEIARGISCGGKPVPVGNFHVTLVFLGPVDTMRQDCVERIATEISDVGPFHLRLDRLGSFARAGIVWSGTTNTSPGLISLVTKLNQGLADCGFQPERRAFTTHVTLFRKADKWVENIPHDPVEWPITDFCLVESSTLPTGARYRVLHRWQLGNSQRKKAGSTHSLSSGNG